MGSTLPTADRPDNNLKQISQLMIYRMRPRKTYHDKNCDYSKTVM